MILSQNPATQETLASFEEPDAASVDRLLSRAAAAQRSWSRVDVQVRSDILRRISSQLRSEKLQLGRLISLEMGKPVSEAVGEIEKCAWNFDFYAREAPAFLQDEVVTGSAADSRIVYDPIGLVLAVMPWNYPFWQVMRAAAPVLAAGNGLVLKHASNVPQCALAIEGLCNRAGLPGGLVTTLLLGSNAVAPLIRDPRIAAVTFTGSTPAGRTIAALAAQELKKQVLELGGSDPFIVLADADVQKAASVAVKARFQNTGQSCIAAKRFIVHDSVADEFVEVFTDLTRKLVVGDPLADGVTQGTMARASLRDELHRQVGASVEEGAHLVVGGHPIEGPGAFYAPTVLDHVTMAMTVGREETFGPAAAILRVPSLEAAIQVANDSPFGLGASVWTADPEVGSRLSRQIESGAVFINAMVASDPRLPFGGTKASGYGRELGALGLREFTNIKTVVVA
jgi:succinate-semialdehyde dehydrogenase/glutarate-semialdehyde dehydrogenase